ncbi:MAG: DnaJ family domain-containing protein [Gammaproteobacteria bacterium]
MTEDESERRKKRDAAIRSIDQNIAEHLEQARRSGELERAESYGRPFADMEGWGETPAELRMPFKILKNAQAYPPEIELFHKRAALRKQVDECALETERNELLKRLNELEQFISMRLERLRITGTL